MATNEKGLVKKEEGETAVASPAAWAPDWRLAKILAGSGLAPKGYQGKPEDCFVAMQMGREIGLQPLQAIQNIAVINGRPCVWGDAALALVQNAADFEWIVENEPKGSADGDFAECIIKRKGHPEVRRTFSWGDANRAKLLQKEGTWQTYPKRMLQMRARGFCLRDAAADILRGLAIREEVEDYDVAVEGPAAEDLTPKRASEAAPEAPQEQQAAAPEASEVPPDAPPSEELTVAQKLLSEKQIKRLFAIAHANGITSERVTAYVAQTFQCDVEDMTRADYDQACAWAEKKR